MSRQRRIRVLQVVGGLNRGGSETWLKNLARAIDRERFAFDFLVHSTGPFDYEDELRSLGANLLYAPRGRAPWTYASKLHEVLRRHGPYDAVHSHVYLFSGVVLAVAKAAGVPKRIVHAHTARAELAFGRRAYAQLALALVRRYATHGLAVSDAAAAAFFGSKWRRDHRWQLAHCGIDLEAFRGLDTRAAVLAEFGIPRDAFVVGHVGRFVREKNHEFIIEILRAASARRSVVHALMIGDGPLRAGIERQVEAFGLTKSVTFCGARADVPRLLSALDAFVFPSLFEGLPLSVVEAQAAGVPVVMSDRITHEVRAIPDLVRTLSLEAGPDAWASAILEGCSAGHTVRANALSTLASTDFDIRDSARTLARLYRE
jgi:glycosyltransferase involved in cell wall biosynthesis